MERPHVRRQTISTFPDLVYSLISSRLKDLAKASNDPRIPQLVDALAHNDVSGALMRYASMAIELKGWIGSRDGGGWAWGHGQGSNALCRSRPV